MVVVVTVTWSYTHGGHNGHDGCGGRTAVVVKVAMIFTVVVRLWWLGW